MAPPRKNTKRDFSNVEMSPDMNQKLDETTNELKEMITKSYETFTAQMEQVLAQMNEKTHNNLRSIKDLMIEEIKKFVVDISQIKEETAQNSKIIATVTSEQKEIASRLNMLEQDRLNNSIEISGLNSSTMNSQKSPEEIASQILNIYNVNNFQSAYKREVTVKSERKSLLIVTFKSYQEKMDALNRKRTADMGKNCTVYFNHSLTSSNRTLYMRARAIAKSLKCKAAISYGRVFIRNPDEKLGTRIKSELDLIKFEAKIGCNHN